MNCLFYALPFSTKFFNYCRFPFRLTKLSKVKSPTICYNVLLKITSSKLKLIFPKQTQKSICFVVNRRHSATKCSDLISEREEKNHIDRSAPNCLCLTSSNKILKKFWFVRFCGFSNDFHFRPFKVISYSWQSIAAVKHKIQCFNVSI